MMFSVPQFIDVEDKIAGPLTWRQLLWMIGMGAIILILFATFETTFAIVLTVPTVLLFMALAFYRPNGFPLVVFIMHGVLFLFRPKIAVWERAIKKSLPEKAPPRAPVAAAPVPGELTPEKIRELARLIDNK